MKTNTRPLFSGQSSADTQTSADSHRLVWQPLPQWKHLQGEALDDAVAQAKGAIIYNSLQLASLCEDAHEWQTALMSYDLVLALDASHVLAHLGRGAVLMQQGKFLVVAIFHLFAPQFLIYAEHLPQISLKRVIPCLHFQVLLISMVQCSASSAPRHSHKIECHPSRIPL